MVVVGGWGGGGYDYIICIKVVASGGSLGSKEPTHPFPRQRHVHQKVHYNIIMERPTITVCLINDAAY